MVIEAKGVGPNPGGANQASGSVACLSAAMLVRAVPAATAFIAEGTTENYPVLELQDVPSSSPRCPPPEIELTTHSRVIRLH